MNNKQKLTTLVVFFSLLFASFGNQNVFASASQIDSTELLKKLSKIEGLTIKKTNKGHFKEAYELLYTQPVDHKNPNGKKFTQLIYLSHIDFDRPTVMVTEGYQAYGNWQTELSRYLNANQVVVEHRFFGKSKPEGMPWEYLDIEQAANDHHRVYDMLNEIYEEKWISTGISKGGQTTLYYKYFFPEDMDVWVPYVAPMNLSKEDPRIYNFLNNVGTKECRQKLIDLQIGILQNKKDIVPMVEDYAKKNNVHFSIGNEAALEMAVMEIPFAFWQWGNVPCSNLPDKNSKPKELFQAMQKIDALSFFTDEGMARMQPFTYQALTQIGFYSYDIRPYREYITKVKDPDFSVFAPKNVELNYSPVMLEKIVIWLQDYGNNVVYIHGENDPWSATHVPLIGRTNSLLIIKPGGCHKARIRNLPEAQRKQVFDKLEKWLDLKIKK